MDYKQYVLDYVEGSVTYEDFLRALEDETFLQWFQEVVPRDHMIIELPTPENHYRPPLVPFDIRLALATLEITSRKGTLGHKVNLQSRMAGLLKLAFPGIQFSFDKTTLNLYSFLLEALPSYIDGVALWNSGLIERLYAELPAEWSKTRKRQAFRAKIREVFHIEGNHYPHWIQQPEWPLCDGRPMRYVKTTKKYKGELLEHRFVDPDTGEERIVQDAY